jgi:hypothetical protein
MTPLGLIPLKAWLVAGGVVLAAFIIWRIHAAIYDRGAADTRTEIHQSNDKARSKADEAARTVENCNGRWDRARGVCVPDHGPGR